MSGGSDPPTRSRRSPLEDRARLSAACEYTCMETMTRRPSVSRRTWIVVAVVLVFAVGIGRYQSVYRLTRVRTVEGTVTAVSQDRLAIGLRADGERDGIGYSLTGLQNWRDLQGQWRSVLQDRRVLPDCIPEQSFGQRVQIGLIDVPRFSGGVGGRDVVWLKCLSAPAK